VRATRRLGEWAVAWGVRNFIHISSPSLYFDYHHHRDVKEAFRPQRYACEFARSKAASEEVIDLLAQSNPHTRFTVLRPQSLFGPHDKVFIPRLAQMMHHYGSVLLPRGGDALVDMTYYENAVHAMWLASQPDCDTLISGRAYNITNGEPCTLRTIVQRLIDELQIDCRIRSVPYPMLDMIARSMERFGNKSAKEPALTLSYYKNRDYACFFSANSTQKPALYDTADATANSRINARLPYIFLLSRIAHYLKLIQRENIGTTKDRRLLELELNTWVRGLVTEMTDPGDELQASHPLRDAKVVVEDIEDNPGFFRVKLYAIPLERSLMATQATAAFFQIKKSCFHGAGSFDVNMA
jgi:hypothetical protein